MISNTDRLGGVNRMFNNTVHPSTLASSAGLGVGLSLLAGEDPASAIIKGGLGGAAFTYLGPLMYGYQAMQLGSMVIGAGSREIHRRSGEYTSGGPRFGVGFNDTEQTYTMRQAGVQAMQESGMNIKQILGNEASFLHR